MGADYDNGNNASSIISEFKTPRARLNLKTKIDSPHLPFGTKNRIPSLDVPGIGAHPGSAPRSYSPPCGLVNRRPDLWAAEIAIIMELLNGCWMPLTLEKGVNWDVRHGQTTIHSATWRSLSHMKVAEPHEGHWATWRSLSHMKVTEPHEGHRATWRSLSHMKVTEQHEGHRYVAIGILNLWGCHQGTVSCATECPNRCPHQTAKIWNLTRQHFIWKQRWLYANMKGCCHVQVDILSNAIHQACLGFFQHICQQAHWPLYL